MQWCRVIILSFIISVKSFAVEDVIFLAEIVSNTAQEIAELEKLINETTKHTKKLSEFADTIDDYSYRAERLKAWSDDLRDLSGEDTKGLEEINSLLRQIRMIEEDTERLYYEYAKRHRKSEHDTEKYKRIARKQLKNSRDYKKQALRAQRNSADSMQQVAQNTATIAYEQSKSNRLIAEQNEKITQIHSLALEKEKRELEKKSRINNKYNIKERKDE